MTFTTPIGVALSQDIHSDTKPTLANNDGFAVLLNAAKRSLPAKGWIFIGRQYWVIFPLAIKVLDWLEAMKPMTSSFSS